MRHVRSIRPRGKTSTMIEIGKPAPNFGAQDQDGKEITLADFKGQPVVLFFFPKTGSKVCTAEACSFQQELPNFESSKAAIVGVSPDSPSTQKLFTEKYRLSYRFLSDPKSRIASSFGVPSLLGILTSRTTIVLDAQGIVRATYRNELNAAAHVEAAKLALEAMALKG